VDYGTGAVELYLKAGRIALNNRTSLHLKRFCAISVQASRRKPLSGVGIAISGLLPCLWAYATIADPKKSDPSRFCVGGTAERPVVYHCAFQVSHSS
jgi:hypothetical protein